MRRDYMAEVGRRISDGSGLLHLSDDSIESTDPKYHLLGQVGVTIRKNPGVNSARSDINEARVHSEEMRILREYCASGKAPVPFAVYEKVLSEDLDQINPNSVLGYALPDSILNPKKVN
jgi:hypothetical protein